MSLADSGADEVLMAMILMTLADGRVAEDELTRIRWIYGEITGRTLSEEDMRATIAAIRTAKLELDAFLRDAAALPEERKRLLLQAAYAVACADGGVEGDEETMLLRVAEQLGITPEQYRAMLTQAAMLRRFKP